jgi:hypothetical protein
MYKRTHMKSIGSSFIYFRSDDLLRAEGHKPSPEKSYEVAALRECKYKIG